MTSRLRKVYLVNAKTSGSTTSARISEIDPRGGAAITGANGAGKTTTLQVIALFFGYSPAQMVQSGENRESMLRFILPHPESAVVFEYQRGDEPQDICHVILRRESNSDVGEYRLVQGPMRVDLLIAADSEGQSVFLDDEGTKETALRLGLGDGFSAKLKLAAYRSVILNVPGTGKDDLHRRNLAQRFSFSRQRLTNLDRLVAAIVKEHINFTDFADVAAQIVMDQMGVGAARANGGKNLQLRQSKQQIEAWLRDRDAIERAIKMEPEVTQLRGVAGEFRTLEMQLGEKRSDCIKLTRLNQDEFNAAAEDKAALDARRKLAQEQFELRKKTLEEALEQAKAVAIKADANHSRLLSKRNFLREEDAQEWAEKWLDLDALKGQEDTMRTVVQTLEGVAASVVNDYDKKLAEIAHETSRRAAEMSEGLEKISALETSEVKTLEQQEDETIERMEAQWSAIEVQAAEHLVQCMGAAADAKANLERPRIEADLQRRLDDARTTRAEHQNQLLQAGRHTAKAQQELNGADQRWQQAERVFNSQKEQLAKAQGRVDQVQGQIKPPAGSLHAALLASPDEDWKKSLAKVISPALLLREDLQPHKVTDDTLLYGWGLDLESIERPEWVEQEDLHRQLAAAERDLQAAANGLGEAKSKFKDAEANRQHAQESLNLAQAQEGVVQSKSDEIAQQLQAVEDAAKMALERIKKDAQRLDEIAARNLDEAKRANEAAKKRTKEERNAVRLEFAEQKQQARQRGQQKRKDLHERITEFKLRQKEQTDVIGKARDAELNEKGVDTKKLSESKKELQSIIDRIRDIENHAALVREWQDWQQQQGPIRLIDAEVALGQANEQRDARALELDRAEHEFRQLKAAIGIEESKIDRRRDTATGQLAILGGLATELEDFAFSGVSTKSINDLASVLKSEVNKLLDQYGRTRQTLRAKLDKVERSLTEGESSTRDFVMGVLQEVAQEAKDLERASAVSRVYDRIKPEVLVNVNTSLRTMLENIATYRKTLWDFESEVRKFNNKLQDGLRKVSRRFTRFTDFKVSVVTDFDKIDFVGKLKVLDDAINEHRDRNVATYAVEPPPATTAHALRSFMTALDKGNLELNLGDHITLSGSVVDDGVFKQFHNATELEKISSNGLTAIALISLLSGLINVIRGSTAIVLPWCTDEIGRFDGPNFQALMAMMAENNIDPVTASPALTPAAYGFFKHRYIFRPGGVIAEYRPRGTVPSALEVPTC